MCTCCQAFVKMVTEQEIMDFLKNLGILLNFGLFVQSCQMVYLDFYDILISYQITLLF